MKLVKFQVLFEKLQAVQNILDVEKVCGADDSWNISQRNYNLGGTMWRVINASVKLSCASATSI